jgi:subtilisin family serine protease
VEPALGSLGAATFAFTSENAARLPGNIAEPFEYLRKNAGLKTVSPIFAPTPNDYQAKPLIADRLALLSSVARPARAAFRGFNTLTLDAKACTPALLKKLNSSAFFDFVEPAPLRYLLSPPSTAAQPDPASNLQWGLRAIRWFSANRPDASQIRVGVIDTGIDLTHPDFNAAAIQYDHMKLGAADIIGHGSHVAGIVAAKANNGVGVAGIANCKLDVWKIFPNKPAPDGEFYTDPDRMVRALGAALDQGTNIVNLSIGGTASSQTEQLIIQELSSNGILVVAAMGNDFEDGNPIEFPAAYPTVLAVGAIGVDQRRASFSCTGKHIGLCAPGVQILSTLPLKPNPHRKETKYASWDGTSMATPHVAGAAALVMAAKGVTGTEAGEILRSTAKKVPDMGGNAFTVQHGKGLIDLVAALS